MTLIPMQTYDSRSDTRPFVMPSFAGPVIKGQGGVTYCCAKCKTPLLQDVQWKHVKDIAVKCGQCRAYNLVPVSKGQPDADTTFAPPSPPATAFSGTDADRKTISVVTPCYNEDENVREVHAAVKAIFDEHLPQYRRQHIFADNASTDRTPIILREMASADPSVSVIFNARNFGPMRSTFNAVMSATGDAVLIFLPADMQDPPDLLPTFVKLWEQGYEIVYGTRVTREEGWIMRSVRNLYYRTLTSLSDLKIPPGVGDFQVVDKSVISAMRRVNDSYPFLRMMTFECGGSRIGVGYRWLARKRGISKNRVSSLIDQGLNGLVSFTTVPLRLGLYVGFVTAFAAILYAAVTLTLELIGAGRAAPPGIATLIVALFFFGGVQLFFMGLIGEYILAIYGQVRSKPVVFERERLNFIADDAARK